MEAVEEHLYDSTSNEDMKTGHNTCMVQSNRKNSESSCEKVIDEFMRSPKASSGKGGPAQSKKLGIQQQVTNSSRNGSKQSASTMPNNNSLKKTGVCVSKCY